jgi:hypothetical protein
MFGGCSGFRIFVWVEKLGELWVRRELLDGVCGHRVVELRGEIDK